MTLEAFDDLTLVLPADGTATLRMWCDEADVYVDTDWWYVHTVATECVEDAMRWRTGARWKLRGCGVVDGRVVYHLRLGRLGRRRVRP